MRCSVHASLDCDPQLAILWANYYSVETFHPETLVICTRGTLFICASGGGAVIL